VPAEHFTLRWPCGLRRVPFSIAQSPVTQIGNSETCMTNTETLSVRIPKPMHDALKERERVTLVPTSRLVRKLIVQELEQKKEQSNGKP